MTDEANTPEAPRKEPEASAPEQPAPTSGHGALLSRRRFGKTLLLGGTGAVLADVSTAGNRHHDTPGMRAAGAAVGAVSMIALGAAMNKIKDDGQSR